MNVHIIRTNGTEEHHEIENAVVFQTIQRLIDAAALDTVNLRDGRVMLVDDAGYDTELVEHEADHAVFGFALELRCTQARKPANVAATTLYHGVCAPGTTHQIVGDVAIVNDDDFAEDR